METNLADDPFAHDPFARITVTTSRARDIQLHLQNSVSSSSSWDDHPVDFYGSNPPSNAPISRAQRGSDPFAADNAESRAAAASLARHPRHTTVRAGSYADHDDRHDDLAGDDVVECYDSRFPHIVPHPDLDDGEHDHNHQSDSKPHSDPTATPKSLGTMQSLRRLNRYKLPPQPERETMTQPTSRPASAGSSGDDGADMPPQFFTDLETLPASEAHAKELDRRARGGRFEAERWREHEEHLSEEEMAREDERRQALAFLESSVAHQLPVEFSVIHLPDDQPGDHAVPSRSSTPLAREWSVETRMPHWTTCAAEHTPKPKRPPSPKGKGRPRVNTVSDTKGSIRRLKKSFTSIRETCGDILASGPAGDVVREGWDEFQLTDLRPATPMRSLPDEDATPHKSRARSFFRLRRDSMSTSNFGTRAGGGESSRTSDEASSRSSSKGNSLKSPIDSKNSWSKGSVKSMSKIWAREEKGRGQQEEEKPLYRAQNLDQRIQIGPTMLHTPAKWALNAIEHERMHAFPALSPKLVDGQVDAYTRHGLQPVEVKEEGKWRVRKLSNKLRKVASKLSLRSAELAKSEEETKPKDFFDLYDDATYSLKSRYGGTERHACYAACTSALKESTHRLDVCVCHCGVCAPGRERRRPPRQ